MNLHMCSFVVAVLLAFQSDVLNAQPVAATKAEPIVTFLSHRSGDNILYRMKLDGTEIKPIFGGTIGDVPSFTEGVTLMRQPHWTRQSSDGKYFASWVYEQGKPYSKWQGTLRPMLWVGDVDGNWTRIVNPDCGEEFAWSPDSRKIAFSILSSDHNRGFFQPKVKSSQICMSGIDGSNTDFVLETRGIWSVQDWSPDGHRLLLLHRQNKLSLQKSTTELYEFNLAEAIDARAKAGVGALAGSEWTATIASNYLHKIQHNLTDLVISVARYSPEGKALAILAYDPKNMFAPNLVADDELGRMRMMRLLCKIATLDISRGTSEIIADYSDGTRGPICWSQDGTEILFSRYLPKDDDREKFLADKEHGLSIWSIGRDGKDARFITTGWSPDCSRVITIR